MPEYIIKCNPILDTKVSGPIQIIGELVRCKDCDHWARNDGMFKLDEREWHHCPHLGIDTDGYFSCIEGKKEE